MAPRFSLPSASVGINRFHCWPVDTTDSYSASDLTANWDYLDALLGAPSGGGAWPPTTGLDGGIYHLISSLQTAQSPIGTTAYWFRPSLSVPLTTITNAGWHLADGTTLTSVQHSFPGLGGSSVTLPDMRNMIVVGADVNTTIGQTAAAVGTTNINTALGAPGPQGTGGSNQIIQSVAQLAQHSHTFSGTALGSHGHTFTGAALPPHEHYSVDYPDQFTQHEHLVEFANDLQGGGGRKAVVDFGGASGATDIYLGIQFSTSADSAGATSGTIGSTAAGTPAGSNSNTGTSAPMDNRPLWIGLVPIIKVLTIS